MRLWVVYALLSMLFVGVTAILSKLGTTGLNSELALAIRSGCVFAMIAIYALINVPREALCQITNRNLPYLLLGAAASTLSLVFYFKAIKIGEVSTITLIDKGSFLIAVLLAWLVLGEAITWQTMLGCSLILAGVIVVAWK